MKELAKQYDPSQVEDRIYQFWLDGGYFHTKADPDKKPYTIVMPPPNVTGQLHMGHAVDNTMQDILIRTKRMQGYAALWVPGTDHASIATEAKVVEAMRAEGLTKEMVGRDGFLERAWAWKTKFGNRIVSQLKKLGSSCDWDRERFTMDEGCSEAVKEVFVRLYDQGLIYRGNRMVNWCPHCNTSISDMTVPPQKPEMIKQAQDTVDRITKNYKRGLITEEERYKEVVDTWKKTDDELTKALLTGLDKYNNIFMMADSGARGSDKQIKQLAGMRGLMADTTGNDRAPDQVKLP